MIQQLEITSKRCEKYYKISYHFLLQWALVPLCLNLILKTVFRHQHFSKT